MGLSLIGGLEFLSFIPGNLHLADLAASAANNFCQLLDADTRH